MLGLGISDTGRISVWFANFCILPAFPLEFHLVGVGASGKRLGAKSWRAHSGRFFILGGPKCLSRVGRRVLTWFPGKAEWVDLMEGATLPHLTFLGGIDSGHSLHFALPLRAAFSRCAWECLPIGGPGSWEAPHGPPLNLCIPINGRRGASRISIPPPPFSLHSQGRYHKILSLS